MPIAKSRISVSIEELVAIELAGGRNGREKSYALEAKRCWNPADVVEFPAEIERQRRLKKAKKSKNKFKHR